MGNQASDKTYKMLIGGEWVDGADGTARALPTANSGDFAGLLGSSGFVEVDERFAGDSPAPYFPWIL